MSTVTTQGPRTIQPTVQRLLSQDGGIGAGAASASASASASGRLAARLPVVDPAAAPDGRVSLSQQALDTRVSQLGERSVDAAQHFVDQLATALFGDGARFSFTSISTSADATLSGALAQGDGGAVASLSLTENAHLIGQGQIITADGASYQVEIEIKYQAAASASATASAPAAPQQQLPLSDSATLIGKQLPAIKYPGSLADLFKVLGRELQASAAGAGDKSDNGALSLRLLRLVNSAALLAPRARADDPNITPAERNKALASYAPATSGVDLGAA